MRVGASALQGFRRYRRPWRQHTAGSSARSWSTRASRRGQLELAIVEQHKSSKPLGQVLVELGFASAGAVANALAEQHGGLLKTEFGVSAGFHASTRLRCSRRSCSCGSPASPRMSERRRLAGELEALRERCEALGRGVALLEVRARAPARLDLAAALTWLSSCRRQWRDDADPRRRRRAEDGEPAPARARRGSPRRRRRPNRRRRALDGACGRVRRDRARRDAARPERLRGLQAAARRRGLVAGADADRPRRGRGSGRRARRGRRRLPAEAVRVRRAARAPPRARPPRRGRAPGGRRGRRPPARPGDAAGLARRRRDPALREGVRAAGDVHAPPGQVLSRYQLLEHAWDYAYENRSNVVDVYVRYLRDKVDRPFGRRSLETVRGAGYRLRKDGGA